MSSDLKNYPKVSVIIPTYNRCDVLQRSLGLLFDQDYPKDKIEICVIDDGSTDETKQVIESIKVPTGIKLVYLANVHKGPAAARNKGILQASGSVVLIINDDTFATRTLISEHVKFHNQFPTDNFAVLGLIAWDKDIPTTAFMKWLEHKGPLFSYYRIQGIYANWRHAWTCNISYKRDFLIKEGLFDEDFPYA
ncbi:MAG: glycosyltransferase family 2 protein, partial [Patescibacteria group bacterium]